MKTFQQGETAKLTCEVTNSAGTLTDPGTSMKITVTDPTGTDQADAQDMTKDATGTYSYHYDIGASAELGVWTYECVAVNNAHTTIKGGSFEVVRRIT